MAETKKATLDLVARLFYSAVGFVPLYATDPAGTNTPSLAAALVAVFSAAYIFLQPLAGRWSDRHGRFGVLMVGLVLSPLSMAAVPLVHTMWLLTAVTVAFGAGVAALTRVSYAIVADRVSAAELGTAMGVAHTLREHWRWRWSRSLWRPGDCLGPGRWILGPGYTGRRGDPGCPAPVARGPRWVKNARESLAYQK